MSRKTYACDSCGLCCQKLIIEIQWLDFQREPRLRGVTKPFTVPAGFHITDDETDEPIEDPDPYMAGAMLACGRNHPCPMLGEDKRCTIYPTRPNCCVAFEPGGEKCQELREGAGLPPLEALAHSH